MSDAQIDSIPTDGNATPILSIVPASFGNIKCMRLTVPAGDKIAVSEADDFPTAGPTEAAPQLTGIWLQNDSSQTVRVGHAQVGTEEEVSASLGIKIVPDGIMLLQADPEKVYVFNPGTGDADLTVLITGKF